MSSKNEHRSFKILSNILTYPIVCNKVEFLFQPTCKLSTGERRKFVLSTFFSGLCNLCVVFTLENLLQYYYYLGSIFFVQGVDFSGQSIQQLFFGSLDLYVLYECTQYLPNIGGQGISRGTFYKNFHMLLNKIIPFHEKKSQRLAYIQPEVVGSNPTDQDFCVGFHFNVFSEISIKSYICPRISWPGQKNSSCLLC